MSFQINPCKAVMKKVKESNCDINTMNDLCYGISNAYGNVYGSKVKSELDKKCTELITKKKCVLGKNTCNLRRPVPPPFFNQIPHYFPRLLKDTNDVDISYKKCWEMCTKDMNVNKCRENCKLEAYAVMLPHKEEYQNIREHIHHKQEKEQYEKEEKEDKEEQEDKEEVDYDGYEKAHPVVFFLGFGVVVLMIFFLLWVFLQGLTIKNNKDV